jgi:hypothetical protein
VSLTIGVFSHTKYFEVVRFSSKASITKHFFHKPFLQWASDLAAKLLKIHNEEVGRRQEFNTLFEGHFLKSLFPGMTELPPSFATQAPSVFDARLPKLSGEDVEYISNAFPEYASGVPNYDMEVIVKFFRQRYFFHIYVIFRLFISMTTMLPIPIFTMLTID